MKSSFYGLIIVFGAFACISLASPVPAVVQGPDQWTLNATFTHPQPIELRQDSDHKTVRFWYMIITLTNNTGRDVDFFPKCDLVTDTFQITPAGKGVGSIVFDRIKERHKSKYPFLEYLGKTDNKILQGEDNAKDIAVIWQDFDHEAKKVSIFITGLSNETIEVEYPTKDSEDTQEEPNKVYLRKTLEIKYDIKGNPASSSGAVLEYISKTWVMR
jgi:hypothetical protein